ncbi:hypothetical protein IL972_13790 [Acinetobacter sp. FL51]|nr:hypothetical protein [Acinetobacter sp. FL51]MBI1452986.1 hypothetical protein [Acinetobacter sp. FL51]
MIEQIKVITRLPNELCTAFLEWLVRGGHDIKVKKDRVVVKKGSKNGEILAKRGSIQPDYAMNAYLIERFKLFSLQWLKYGKAWVEELDNSMMCKFVEVQRQINLAKVA